MSDVMVGGGALEQEVHFVVAWVPWPRRLSSLLMDFFVMFNTGGEEPVLLPGQTVWTKTPVRRGQTRPQRQETVAEEGGLDLRDYFR